MPTFQSPGRHDKDGWAPALEEHVLEVRYATFSSTHLGGSDLAARQVRKHIPFSRQPNTQLKKRRGEKILEDPQAVLSRPFLDETSDAQQ